MDSDSEKLLLHKLVMQDSAEIFTAQVGHQCLNAAFALEVQVPVEGFIELSESNVEV